MLNNNDEETKVVQYHDATDIVIATVDSAPLPETEVSESYPIESKTLLKGLSNSLGMNGNIKDKDEVQRLVDAMKLASKLVSKCTYINILRATKEQDVLAEFIEKGGWEVLNDWLQYAKDDDNTPMLLDLIKIYEQLPVTVSLLKQNASAKTIKQLSKAEDEGLRQKANDLVAKWMDRIKTKSSDSERSKKKKSKHPKDSRTHKKEYQHEHTPSPIPDGFSLNDYDHNYSKSNGHSEDGAEDNASNSESVHPSVHAVNDVKLLSKDVESSKDEKSRDISLKNEKHKSSSSKSIHSAAHTSKDEKRTHSDRESLTKKDVRREKLKHTASSSGLDAKAKVKSDLSKPRPKTVKTAPAKFRETGLDTETPLPQVKKKSTPDKKLPIKRPSSSKLPDNEKKSRPTLPAPISVNTSPSSTTATTTVKSDKSPSPTETHGKIKLIAPLPRHDVYESSDFMNAITTSRPTTVRKRKRAGSITGQASNAKTATSPTSTSKKQPAVMSFYKETLDANDDKKKDDSSSVSSEKDASASPRASEDSNDATQRKRSKKSVSWAKDENLRSFHYFEMDENERVNVNRAKDIDDMKKREMMMERQNFAKRSQYDNELSMKWRKPALLTGLPEQSVIRGCNSKEYETQKERELGVLQAIYFTRDMIPDSPAEPDIESTDMENSAPATIPLEDESGAGGELVYKEYPAPVKEKPHKPRSDHREGHVNKPPGPGHSGSQFSLPPDVANLLSSMANQIQGQTPQQQQQQEQLHLNQMQQQQMAQLMNDPNLQATIMNVLRGNPSGADDETTLKVKELLEPIKDQIQGYGSALMQNFQNFAHPMNNMMGPMHGMGPMGGPHMGGPPMGGPGFGPRPPMMDMGPGGPPPWGMGPRGMRGPPGPGMIRGRFRGDRPVCHHFMTPKGCKFGPNCRMLHPGINGPPL